MKNATYFITGILLLLLVSLCNHDPMPGGETIARAGINTSEIARLERQVTWQWIAGGMKRVWWYAEYENGMVVFTHPENYRTTLEVVTYYLGGGGAWKAFYFDDNGRENDLCYQDVECAALYIHLWGSIIDLKYKDQDGQWISIWEETVEG